MARYLSESLKPNHQLGATSIARKFMNFVDDNPPNMLQVGTHQSAGKDCLQRFRRCNQEIWWLHCLFTSLLLRRISVSHLNCESKFCSPEIEAFHKVPVQCSQRRYVYYRNSLSLFQLRELV